MVFLPFLPALSRSYNDEQLAKPALLTGEQFRAVPSGSESLTPTLTLTTGEGAQAEGGGGTASLKGGTYCQTTAPAFQRCPSLFYRLYF